MPLTVFIASIIYYKLHSDKFTDSIRSEGVIRSESYLLKSRINQK